MVYCTLKIGMEMTDCASPKVNKSGSLVKPRMKSLKELMLVITGLTTSYLPPVFGLE
jgi:hypothetical protein